MEYSVHDIGQEKLESIIARHHSPDILLAIVVLSKKTFAWFSRRSTRADEYIWVAEHVKVQVI